LENNFLRGVAVVAMAFAILMTPLLPAGLEIVATVVVAIAVGWRAR